MGLKRFTRISEWEVEIGQGILGIRNISLTDKYKNKSTGLCVVVKAFLLEMISVQLNLSKC
jgi:hypothetical protein